MNMEIVALLLRMVHLIYVLCSSLLCDVAVHMTGTYANIYTFCLAGQQGIAQPMVH